LREILPRVVVLDRRWSCRTPTDRARQLLGVARRRSPKRARRCAESLSVLRALSQPWNRFLWTGPLGRQWSVPLPAPGGLSLKIAVSCLRRLVAWSRYDGTGASSPTTGESDECPYDTGDAALQDGWRLFQASQLFPRIPAAGGMFPSSNTSSCTRNWRNRAKMS
jgi:hypothetical protein